MKILVTGGAGFIGSNFIHHIRRQHPDWCVIALDKLTYAGNLANLAPVRNDPQVSFIQMDICDRATLDVMRGCDVVVNFAAETHVDRSIESAAAFVRTNVEGTFRLLESCREARVPRFLQISTDEVYGSLGWEGKFSETTPLAPTSPYAATKAAADLLVLTYVNTHHIPAIITRCSNNYGPYQFPEKFIPLMIVQAMDNRALPVYGDGRNIRDWIYVEDHCRALDLVLQQGREGEIYNIGGDCEMENIAVARRILHSLERPDDLVRYVTDRPGHDRRYAIDCAKIKSELGWVQRFDFSRGLAATIEWYRKNSAWLSEICTASYRDYVTRHYGNRDATLAAVKPCSADGGSSVASATADAGG